jgi:hypothetical protein
MWLLNNMDTNKTAKLQTTQISDTLSNLQTLNPILLNGQIAIARNNNSTYLTVGNGSSNFNDLPLEIIGSYGSMIPDYKNIENTNRLFISSTTTQYHATNDYRITSNSWTCDKNGFIRIICSVGIPYTTNNNYHSEHCVIDGVEVLVIHNGYLNSGDTVGFFNQVIPIAKDQSVSIYISTQASITLIHHTIICCYIPPLFI